MVQDTALFTNKLQKRAVKRRLETIRSGGGPASKRPATAAAATLVETPLFGEESDKETSAPAGAGGSQFLLSNQRKDFLI